MLLSVRHLRVCSFTRSSLLSPAAFSLTKRSFLTDGANVIGSNPERNSPDFKVTWKYIKSFLKNTSIEEDKIHWQFLVCWSKLSSFVVWPEQQTPFIKAFVHRRCFKVKMPVTVTHDSQYCTCLDHLCGATKSRKRSYLCRAAQGVAVSGVIALTFANGNTALKIWNWNFSTW